MRVTHTERRNEKHSESRQQKRLKCRRACRMAHTLTTTRQEAQQASLHVYLMWRMRSGYLLPCFFCVRGALRPLGAPRPPCGDPPSWGPDRPAKGSALVTVLVTRCSRPNFVLPESSSAVISCPRSQTHRRRHLLPSVSANGPQAGGLPAKHETLGVKQSTMRANRPLRTPGIRRVC